MSVERTNHPSWPSEAVAIQQVAAAPLPLALMSPDGVVLATSASFRAQISDSELNEDLTKQRVDLRREALRRCRAGETVRDPEIQMSDPDGAVRWVQVERGPCYDAAGQVVAILGHVTNVTEQVLARRALVEVQDQLTAALGIDRMSVVVVNVKTRETTVACVCEELVDVLQDVGPELLHVLSEDRPALQATIEAWAAHKMSGILRCEYRLARNPDMWVLTTSRGYLDENGEVDRVINVFQDITDRRKAREEIERLAFTDALTGLPNRAKFQLEFDKAVEAAQKTGRPMGLIMVDVDHFKAINDTLGHDAGDALLTALGGQLRKAFRRGDLVARLGGDEFAILLPDAASENDLMRPLAAIQSALTSPIDYKGQGIRICTSIGAALHADADADPSHVLKNADIALYKAKEQGRDQVVLFEPQMRSEVEQRLELLRDVRMAIPRGEFILFYQPVVSVGQSKVSGFEALMRWNHPDQGILLPATFMAAFEDHDLSLQLGEIAIETALKQIKAWMEQGLEFGRVSINLTAAQFRTGRLAQDLRARMQYWGVPAERLAVEVTENVYLGWGAEIVSETVRELHDQGVTIALDDFGTGYASLANLRQFPIDRLKIDKSFVQNIDDDAIVRAVINLGASMGMEVVAEGVERPEQLSALLRHGCDQVQGFHFAKPMPPAEVPGYLRHFAGSKSGRSAA